MFGDMFYVAVSTLDNGKFCEGPQDSGAIEDFCNNPWASYLRIYSILIGDFELDDMRETTGTLVLFLIFTILGVIILLNVLIAVISDSYERATMSSGLLFGRARVFYVAQNEALERILRPRPRRARCENGEIKNKLFYCLRQTLRWTILLTILGTAFYSLLFDIATSVVTAQSGNIIACVIVVLMSMILLAALWVVCTFIVDNLMRILLPDQAEAVYDLINRITGAFVCATANFLFGLKGEDDTNLSGEGEADVEWNEKLRQLENVMARVMEESKTELKAEILEIKTQMQNNLNAVHTKD